MPIAGPLATNSYVNFLPGLIGGCVTSGTPSIAFGTSMPWKCTTVDCGSWLSRTKRTLSPTSTLIHGPGTCSLYAQAFTFLPGATSQSMTDALMSNSLVPSGNTLGAMGWLPTPFVFAPLVSCATYASVGAFMTASALSFCASISSWLMPAWSVLSPLADALDALPTLSVATMPASL